MTQPNKLRQPSGINGTLAATTVAVAGLTTIGEYIDVSNFETLFVRINNDDAAAIVFDAFEIQASADETNFDTLYNSSGEFIAPSGILIGTSGDLTTLAAATSGWFILNCKGLYSVRLQASADTTQSVGVTGSWSAD